MISIYGSIGDICEVEWNRLLGHDGCPFLDYRFLRALERSGCVGADSGWSPLYLTYGASTPRMALAAFIKSHSYGEYIFDWAWADAAFRLGREYYPKIVCAAPFSPVAGARFLGDSADLDAKKALVMALEDLTQRVGGSSIHFLFSSENEAEYLAAQGFIHRETFQFQWLNEGYESFDAYLTRFRSKRRNQIRRERKRALEHGVTLNVLMGQEITQVHMDRAFEFYANTVERFYQGQRYLNRSFFRRLLEVMPEKLCLIQAEKDGEIIAGTFNLVSDGVFYGRYWGAFEELKDLHFEMCCYAPIELAIKHGWRRVELGAGGQHKWGRGYLPRLTHSAHKIFIDELVEPISQAVAHESAHLRKEIEVLKHQVLKPREG